MILALGAIRSGYLTQQIEWSATFHAGEREL